MESNWKHDKNHIDTLTNLSFAKALHSYWDSKSRQNLPSPQNLATRSAGDVSQDQEPKKKIRQFPTEVTHVGVISRGSQSF